MTDQVPLTNLGFPDKRYTRGGASVAALQTDKKSLFIQAYLDHGSLSATATAIGVSYTAVRSWIKSDPAFAAQYAILKERRIDTIITSLYLAGQGIQRLTPAQVTSCIFLLKAFDPHRFSEKWQGILAGDINVKVVYEDVRKLVDANPDQYRVTASSTSPSTVLRINSGQAPPALRQDSGQVTLPVGPGVTMSDHGEAIG